MFWLKTILPTYNIKTEKRHLDKSRAGIIFPQSDFPTIWLVKSQIITIQMACRIECYNIYICPSKSSSVKSESWPTFSVHELAEKAVPNREIFCSVKMGTINILTLQKVSLFGTAFSANSPKFVHFSLLTWLNKVAG